MKTATVRRRVKSHRKFFSTQLILCDHVARGYQSFFEFCAKELTKCLLARKHLSLGELFEFLVGLGLDQQKKITFRFGSTERQDETEEKCSHEISGRAN